MSRAVLAAVVRRSSIAGLASILMFALPSPVLGHELAGRMSSPLPLAAYLAGAAMAVALSFAFVLLRDVRAPEPRPRRFVRAPRWLVLALRTVGLVGWLWIVAQTIVGGSSSASVGPLFLWVYGWVGIPIISAFVGPIWTWLDPFSTLYDIGAAATRRLGIAAWAPAEYPAALGTWPATVGLVAVVAFELVFQGVHVGLVLLAYTTITLLGMANFGRDQWRERAETFSVWFGLLNRMAPYAPASGDDARLLVRRSFGAGLADRDWSLAKLVMLAVGVGSILYDGLSQTRPWLEAFGFPSVGQAGVELVVFLAIIVALVLLVARMVGIAAVGAGLLPVAMGYLVAHYLTYLLGEGQRIVVALSDPLQLGWDLFGTAYFEPSPEWIPPVAVWTVMLLGVVGGHMLGAWSGHLVASATSADRAGSNVRLRQVPLALLMVVLTTVTLWSLGQAIVQEVPPQALGGAEAAAVFQTPQVARTGS